jgi:hypothetical protein
MKTRFINFLGSPDASEGTNVTSNYSTERSPSTALLFEATRTVLLPLVRFVEALPSAEELLDAERNLGRSVQEQ